MAKIIVNEFSNNPKVFIWNGEGTLLSLSLRDFCSLIYLTKVTTYFCFYVNCIDPNPHMGHLAWADAFLITADSVSMLSEACSTGYVWYMKGVKLMSLWLDYSSEWKFIWCYFFHFFCCRKPVYVIGAERCTWKFAYFQKSLQERGVVRPFTGKEDVSALLPYWIINMRVCVCFALKMLLYIHTPFKLIYEERKWSEKLHKILHFTSLSTNI